MKKHLRKLIVVGILVFAAFVLVRWRPTAAPESTAPVAAATAEQASPDVPGPTTPPAPNPPRTAAAQADSGPIRPTIYDRSVPPADAPSFDPRTRLLDSAAVVAVADGPPDAKRRFERVSLLKAAFKYPLLRAVSYVRPDPRTGEDLVEPGHVMVADHILVKLREGVTEDDLRALNRRTGAVIRKSLHTPGLYLVAFENPDLNLVPRQVEAYLAEAALVAYAEPDYLVFATATFPNDPRFSDLYGMHNTGQTGGTPDADIDAPEAWDISTGNPNLVVGVIDTGVAYNHEDLAANMWVNPGEVAGNAVDDDGNGFVDDIYGWDFANDDSDPFDDGDHGSHVSGTIAGVGDNGIGVVGVCWHARIMGLKFLSGGGTGSTSDAVDSMNYAVMMRRRGVNIRLTNNSWGGGGFSQSLLDAIIAGADEDMLFVAAAGNDSSDTDATPHYPSSYVHESIISVANTTHNDTLSSLSNYGAVSVDLSAPGSSILSTIPGNNYLPFSGTSMASPHVAGVAALVWSVNPNATYQDVRAVILAGVDPVPALTGRVVTGGRLNARSTLEQLGMLVRSSVPAAGEIVSIPPSEFRIQFSHVYDSGSIQPSDLSVNGVLADSLGVASPAEVPFLFNATPVTAEGLHTMSIPEGAVTRSSDGDGVQAWTATFRYDSLRLAVTSTTPPDGANVALPLTSVRFDFNETVDPSSVDTTNLALSQGRVVGAATVDVDTVEYMLDGVTAEGVLALSMAAGALTDVHGNPSLAYAGSLDLDFGSVPVSDGFKRVKPEGSLVYGLDVEGRVLPALDQDQFTMDLDPGQTVTVTLAPEESLQPTLTLLDPSNAVAATSSPASPGDAVLLQAAAVNVAGTYILQIAGSGASTGSYEGAVHLNAGRELESFSGPANDVPAAAQDLDPLFLPLGPASKASVFGDAGVVGSVAPIAAETEPNDDGVSGGSIADLPFANDWTGSFASSGADRYSASVSGSISSGSDGDWDFFKILVSPGDAIEIDLRGALSGVGTLPDPYLRLYDRNGNQIASNDDANGLESRIEFSNFAYAGEYYVVADSFGSSTGTYLLEATQITTDPLNGISAGEDWFSFTLASNDVADLVLSAAGSSVPMLELYSGPNLVAASIDRPGLGRAIPGFPAPAAGTYHARVMGAAPYHLVITRQAAFADGRRSEFATARDITLAGHALGRLRAAGDSRLFALPTDGSSTIVELDPATGDELRRIPTPEAPSGGPDALAYSGASLFFYNSFGSLTLWELDPDTGAVLDSDPMPSAHAASDGMTVLNDLLYILDYGGSDIAVFDPDTDTVVTVLNIDALNPGTALVGGLGAIADPEALVATDGLGARIVEIDPATGLITSEFVPETPGAGEYISLAVIEQELYLGTYTLNTLDVFNRGGALLRSLSLPYSLSGLAAAPGVGSEAWYALQVNSGDSLNLSTLTPGDGPLQFVNGLDPALGLYGPDGALIDADDNSAADGRNAALAYGASTGGTYRVRVASTNETAGEYLVSVTGATGDPLPFSVLASSPEDGALLGVAPTQLVLDFSVPIAPGSLAAGDLLIDGVPASAVTLIDGDTFSFDLPALAHGPHSFALPAGAITSLAGAPVEAFLMTIEVDLVPPRVVASSLQEADIVPVVGGLTYTAVFSEPLSPVALDAADLQLEGELTGPVAPQSFNFEPSNLTLTVVFPSLPDDQYQLTLVSGNAAFEDRVGHDLDGEALAWPIPPNVSGNGIAGGSFLVEFDADAAVAPWPSAFRARTPLGAMVYESSARTRIVPAGDADRYTVALDAGQVLTAVAVPEESVVRPRLDVHAPNGALLGGTTAPSGGAEVILQALPVAASGVYTVTVAGVDAAVGSVRLDLFLNGVREAEAPLAATNDGPAEAEDLDVGTVAVAGGSVMRSAVMGSAAVAGMAPRLRAEIEPNDDGVAGGSAADLPFANDLSGSFTDIGGDTYSAALRGRISSGSDLDFDFFRVLASPGDRIEIDLKGAPSGSGTLSDPYLRLYDEAGSQIATDDDGGVGLESLLIFENFTYQGSYYVVADSFGTGTGTYTLEVRHTTANPLNLLVPGEDWYRFDLTAAEEVSLVLGSSEPGSQGLELYGPGGTTLLATGIPSGNSRGLINGFVAPATDTYFARIQGRSDYTLALVRGAWFDAEPNGDSAQAALVPGEGNVLGHLRGSGLERLYVVDASADTIRELDPVSGAVRNSFASPVAEASGPDYGLATSGSSLLVGGSSGNAIYELDPETGTTLRTLPNPGVEVSGMAYLEGEIFLLTDAASTITVLDYGDGSVRRTLSVQPATLSESLGASHDRLLGLSGTTLISVDPDTGVTTEVGTLTDGGEGLGVVGDELFIASFSAVAVYDLDTLNLKRTLQGLNDLEGVGADGSGSEIDVVRFDVNAGDELHLSTLTPGDGPFDFQNGLDPALMLFDPAGTLVASDDNGALDGRNAEILITAATAGVYAVHAAPAAMSSGEYLLRVAGATGPGPGFRVTSSDPADAASLVDIPGEVILTVNESILLSSVEAADFQVNGLPAVAVRVIDAKTVAFELPGLSTGHYDMTLAAGALTSIGGRPLEPFASTFTVQGPRVVESSIQEDDTVATGALTATFTFNRRMMETNLDVTDVVVEGQARGAVTPDAVQYLAGTPTSSVLEVRFDVVHDDSYQLTLLSGDGQFEDEAGHDLDGEAVTFPVPPNVSGDGVAGGDFVVQFHADTGVEPLPGDFSPRQPLGGLVYEATVVGAIQEASDEDRFTVDVAAHETLTMVLEPSPGYAPTMRLLDEGFSVVADGHLIQTVATNEATTWTLSVSGAGSGIGTYAMRILLNAAVEIEAQGEAVNNTAGAAQDLSGSAIPVGDGHAERCAVAGSLWYGPSVIVHREDFERGVLGSAWSTYHSEPGGRIRATDVEGGAEGSYALLMDRNPSGPETLNEAIWTVDLSGAPGAVLELQHAEWYDEDHEFTGDFTGHADADGAAISDDGVNWHPVLNAPGQPSRRWRPHVIDLGAEAAAAGMSLGPDFRIKLQQYDDGKMRLDGRGWDDLRISVPQTDEDWYEVSLEAQQSATFVVAAPTGATVSLQLFADDGSTRLAAGLPAAPGVTVVNGFVAPSTGDYLVRIAGTAETYDLLVTKDIDFDIEPNTLPARIRDVSHTGRVMGHVGVAESDSFLFETLAGDSLELIASTPFKGPPGMDHGLLPILALVSPGGSTQMVANASTTGVAVINHVALEDGAYMMQIGSSASTGEYELAVSGATGAALADLVVWHEEAPVLSGVGCFPHFVVVVSNQGPSVASGVMLAYDVDPGMRVASASVSQGDATTAPSVWWDVGSLPVGQTASLDVATVAVSGGELTNVASVTAYAVDPNLADNVSTSLTSVVPGVVADARIVNGAPIVSDPPIGPVQNRIGDAFDLDTSGGALLGANACGNGQIGEVFFNYDATNLYVGGRGLNAVLEENAVVLFMGLNTLADDFENSTGKIGAPSVLNLMDNLRLESAMDIAIVLGDEHGDETEPVVGQGIYRLGGTGFQPIVGATLSQFDGSSTNETVTTDDDGNSITDRWEVLIPWSSLNAPSGIVSVTSLRVAGVMVGESHDTHRYIYGPYVGASVEGKTNVDGEFEFEDVYLRGVAIGLPDRDEDGLPDWWEELYGLNPDDDGTTDPNNGPDGDPDGDAATNAEERAAGTNPRDAGSVFVIADMVMGPTDAAVTVLTQPGQRYEIEYRDGGLTGADAWKPFANHSDGIGTWIEQATSPTNFTFVDDFTPATSGLAPTGTASRAYRVQTEEQ